MSPIISFISSTDKKPEPEFSGLRGLRDRDRDLPSASLPPPFLSPGILDEKPEIISERKNSYLRTENEKTRYV